MHEGCADGKILKDSSLEVFAALPASNVIASDSPADADPVNITPAALTPLSGSEILPAL